MHPSLRSVLSSCLAIGLLTTFADAQRATYVVDTNLGAGAHFATIGAALAVANHGDVIEVRAGDYVGFETDKGVRVMGLPGARITEFQTLFGMAIRDLPAGESFVLQGFVILRTGLFGSHAFDVTDCDGEVLLDGVTTRAGVGVSGCAAVTIHDCEIRGFSLGFGLRIEDSTVSISNSELFGASAQLRISGTSALLARGSTVTASRCRMFGGASDPRGPVPGASAIHMDSATLTLTGDGSGRISSGDVNVLAVTGNGALSLHPSVPLPRSQIGAAVTVTTRARPSLATTAEPLGGMKTVDLWVTPGAPFALVFGRPGLPTPLPGFGGALWLDLSQPLITAAVGIATGGRFLRQYPISNDPKFVGERFAWQAFSLENGAVLLSNDDSYVIRR